MVKIFKILFRKFSSPYRSTCCVQIFEIWPTENGWNRTKHRIKISPGSPAVATARIAPKIYQGQPPTMFSECSRFHPNKFTIGEVVAERTNTTKMRRKVNPMFGWRLSSSRIITARQRDCCSRLDWLVSQCVVSREKSSCDAAFRQNSLTTCYL